MTTDFDFDKNDRESIEAALEDPSAENPIAMAVAKAIEGFTARLVAQARRNGRFPLQLLLLKPETVFDDIVIRLALQTIADELGHKITIHWIPR